MTAHNYTILNEAGDQRGKEPKWKTTKNRDETKQQPKQQHNALGDIVHDLMMGSDCPHQSELLVRQKPSLLQNRDGRGAFQTLIKRKNNVGLWIGVVDYDALYTLSRINT